MHIPGASSTAIRAVTAGPLQPAQWLGAVDAALYFATTGPGSTVFAVLSHDAVRLPCGLVLATTTAELPLASLAPARALREHQGVVVGEGRIEWLGPDGAVTVVAARQWSPLRVRPGAPRPGALTELRALLAGREIGLEPHRLAELTKGATAAAVAGLLGCGPGLTPSGDDVLAGYLVGAGAFGLPVEELRRSVAARSGQATSALSAQLLRHAAQHEAVAELVELVAALTHSPAELTPVLTRLLQVGHTSGAALAWGVLLAGERAGRHHPVLSIPHGGHR
ncbi:DUF2877 domain-containing protein [Rhodococcus sp. X156]|uniref:DUF2877 domain-containing protein n=1 Tax=Rhodococcus sp. X156 TaxID=2499145 RepID=UPI000FDAB7F3|nr:DUF2877 domain-containing protein [Rhodococcus sp. X156]